MWVRSMGWMEVAGGRKGVVCGVLGGVVRGEMGCVWNFGIFFSADEIPEPVNKLLSNST